MTLGDRIVVMKDGIVQQTGSPLEVYRAPTNRFVAGFLGSPAMNFVEVQLRRVAGGLAISGLGADIPLPDQMSQSLASHADNTVVLGVRPEHIAIGEMPGVNTVSLEGNILFAEQLGAQQVFEVKIGQKSMMVAGVDPDLHADRNQRASLSIMFDHLHLFETGEQGTTIRAAKSLVGPRPQRIGPVTGRGKVTACGPEPSARLPQRSTGKFCTIACRNLSPALAQCSTRVTALTKLYFIRR